MAYRPKNLGMADKICQLPDSVANQIAAGEVVQRPSSVIKELVENAIDAGADDIRIIIKDAGRTLIQVIDNGEGMTATDARMAFERHATSKIKAATDLACIHTMGFRGEALPSICAISQVELRSRTPGSPIGTRLLISASKVESQTPEVCDFGTNIMVKNLFYNVPARRKFLKSDSVELSHIMREFEKLALVNPGVKMSIDTGSKTIELRKGNLRQRIGEIWKGSLVQQLLPVEADTPSVKISGYITRPEFARRRNALQFFLVNGRNMKHPYFRKAVLNCFNGLIAPETMPCYFIKFDIDPSAIDVNVHPTKDEIKFEEEAVIWSILSAAVKGSLGKNAAVPSIDFESEALPVSPIDPKEVGELPAYDIPLDYNPFISASKPAADSESTSNAYGVRMKPAEKPAKDWEKLYEGFMNNRERPIEQLNPKMPEFPEFSQADDFIIKQTLQYNDKYIVACVEGTGVIIIDQYRAHLKILFEQLVKQLRDNKPVSQALLFPELLEISPEQEGVLSETRIPMQRVGLIIEKEGDNYLITGTPPGVNGQTAVEIVSRVLESVSDGTSNYGDESAGQAMASINEKIALTMAGSMAVKRGRSLSEEERMEITVQLFKLPDPSFTPSGRRIFTVLDVAAIEKLLP